MFEELADRVNTTPNVLRLGQDFSERFLIGYGDEEFHVQVENGSIVRLEKGPFRMRPWRFAIRADQSTWAKFAERYPPPGFHDILAFHRYGHGCVEGDIAYLLTHLRYIKAVLALTRKQDEGGLSNA